MGKLASWMDIEMLKTFVVWVIEVLSSLEVDFGGHLELYTEYCSKYVEGWRFGHEHWVEGGPVVGIFETWEERRSCNRIKRNRWLIKLGNNLRWHKLLIFSIQSGQSMQVLQISFWNCPSSCIQISIHQHPYLPESHEIGDPDRSFFIDRLVLLMESGNITHWITSTETRSGARLLDLLDTRLEV